MKKFHFNIKKIFAKEDIENDLILAQYRSMSKQLPVLFFILASSCLTLVVTFHDIAPAFLGLYVPMALILVSLMRGIWWASVGSEPVTVETARRRLKSTVAYGTIVALSFIVWALSLYVHADDFGVAQLNFSIALTVIGSVVCLMHVRTAAMSISFFVNALFGLYLLMCPHPTQKAMAANLWLVSAGVLLLIRRYNKDFIELVSSRRALDLEQNQTKALAQANSYIARHDGLTGLANRHSFKDSLALSYDQARAQSSSLAIGILDLDGFKTINDVYGHAFGDLVLKEVSLRLKTFQNETVFVARLDGDEFGLIMDACESQDVLLNYTNLICRYLEQPYLINGIQAQLSASVGLSLYPDHSDTKDGLFEKAAYALEHAKLKARGQTILFDETLESEIRKQANIEQALATADLEKELSLQFQPIIDLTTRRIYAFEALARWQSQTLGNVSPQEFILVAERKGRVRELTKILLKKALNEMATWPSSIRVSFNLSAHDICIAEGALSLIALIYQSGVDPKRIDFEITETAMAFDFEQVKTNIDALKALGVGISLDDFGTGYSSLSYVHQLPLNKLKIDKSFVQGLDDSHTSGKIIRSLAGLCQDLELGCVVEGVETQAQLLRLEEMGCRYVQGYFFSKPLKSEDVHSFIHKMSGLRLVS